MVRPGAKAKYTVQWGQGLGSKLNSHQLTVGLRYLCIFKDLSSNTLLGLLNLFHTPRHFTVNRNLLFSFLPATSRMGVCHNLLEPWWVTAFNVNYSIRHLFAREIVQADSLSLQPVWKGKDLQIFCCCFQLVFVPQHFAVTILTSARN